MNSLNRARQNGKRLEHMQEEIEKEKSKIKRASERARMLVLRYDISDSAPHNTALVI